MRNALILLAAVALLILVAGAMNNGVAFDVDYVAGTVRAVSLFWVAAIIAAVVFVVGAIAAWLAQRATIGSRRKLEAELQSTYERLREAESLAARVMPAAATTVVEDVAVVAAAEDVTIAAAENAGQDATMVDAGEEATIVDAGGDATVVSAGEVGAASEAGAREGATSDAAPPDAESPVADEATAITVVGEAASETGTADAPLEPDDPRAGEAGSGPETPGDSA